MCMYSETYTDIHVHCTCILNDHAWKQLVMKRNALNNTCSNYLCMYWQYTVFTYKFLYIIQLHVHVLAIALYLYMYILHMTYMYFARSPWKKKKWRVGVCNSYVIDWTSCCQHFPILLLFLDKCTWSRAMWQNCSLHMLCVRQPIILSCLHSLNQAWEFCFHRFSFKHFHKSESCWVVLESMIMY